MTAQSGNQSTPPAQNQQPRNEPIWSKEMDPTHNTPYFFNRITKQSQWEQPKDFDGIGSQP